MVSEHVIDSLKAWSRGVVPHEPGFVHPEVGHFYDQRDWFTGPVVHIERLSGELAPEEYVLGYEAFG